MNMSEESLIEKLQDYVTHLEEKIKDNNFGIKTSERLDETVEMGVRCTAYREDINDLYRFFPELKKYKRSKK